MHGCRGSMWYLSGTALEFMVGLGLIRVLHFSGGPEGKFCLRVNTSLSSFSGPASCQPFHRLFPLLCPECYWGLWEARQSPTWKGCGQGLQSRGGWGSFWTTCSSSPSFLISGMSAHPAVREPVSRADEREKTMFSQRSRTNSPRSLASSSLQPACYVRPRAAFRCSQPPRSPSLSSPSFPGQAASLS